MVARSSSERHAQHLRHHRRTARRGRDGHRPPVAVHRPAACAGRVRRLGLGPPPERPRREAPALADGRRLRRGGHRRHAPGGRQRLRRAGRPAGHGDPALAHRRRRPRPLPHDGLALGPRRPRGARLDRRHHRAVGPLGPRARVDHGDALRGQDRAARRGLARDRHDRVPRPRRCALPRAAGALVPGERDRPRPGRARRARRPPAPAPAQVRHQCHGLCRADLAAPRRGGQGRGDRDALHRPGPDRAGRARAPRAHRPARRRPRDHRRAAALRAPARPHRATPPTTTCTSTSSPTGASSSSARLEVRQLAGVPLLSVPSATVDPGVPAREARLGRRRQPRGARRALARPRGLRDRDQARLAGPGLLPPARASARATAASRS